MSAYDCHRQECTNLAKYLMENKCDPYAKMLMNHDKWIMKNSTDELMFDDEAIEKEHVKSLNKMNLHGNFFRTRAAIPEVNTTESNQWLETAHLRFETESLICAAQEQALATNNIKAKVWKMEKYSPMCRLCKEQPETIAHIVAGCKHLAANKYLFRHDQVGKYIHWNLLKDRGIEVPKEWLHHVRRCR